ncbi:nuclear transport factor 2 family protein [Beijerinckia indica]|uniref:SnoaL-like domain-containing protein n=1 Tax=Beijerinckia indica subsp. indica (strain ATCC 9039 / DSM 1715 / NCIMB 8712) TaxID=395963 RepID=B2IHF2_BEII9|nr:nuclear transport factor 2 family protein [Beijerinckia indica]ACB95937.1 conserved hypothetical protein [Beijerinckia indica subsp. indica ATCC 9039]
MDEILAANALYYAAFSSGDFAKMSALWAPEDISCVHPGWPVLIGRPAVLDSYRNILRNPAQEPIVARDEIALISGNEGRVCCVELAGDMPLATTNWFRRIDGVWRMIHHQASPIAAMVQQATEERPPSPKRLN